MEKEKRERQSEIFSLLVHKSQAWVKLELGSVWVSHMDGRG